jgi:hypothetical protein
MAYRAKNGTTVAQRGVCTVDAKPTFKLAKPGFYSFAPQVFSLAHASSKFTYIGAFSLAPSPAVIKIERVWITCPWSLLLVWTRPGGLRAAKVASCVYLPTAAVVVEVVSPDDETFEALPFYGAHDVEEVLVVEPEEQRVLVFGLRKGSYKERDASVLLSVSGAEVARALHWPKS